jgi:DNA adenine methylase
MRPFLKWLGAKTKLVAAIRDAAPLKPRRLIEPFVGSGAVALNLRCESNLLADSNPDLVDVFAELQRDGAGFIAECDTLFTPETNCATVYYALREEFNATPASLSISTGTATTDSAAITQAVALMSPLAAISGRACRARR